MQFGAIDRWSCTGFISCLIEGCSIPSSVRMTINGGGCAPEDDSCNLLNGFRVEKVAEKASKSLNRAKSHPVAMVEPRFETYRALV